MHMLACVARVRYEDINVCLPPNATLLALRRATVRCARALGDSRARHPPPRTVFKEVRLKFEHTSKGRRGLVETPKLGQTQCNGNANAHGAVGSVAKYGTEMLQSILVLALHVINAGHTWCHDT